MDSTLRTLLLRSLHSSHTTVACAFRRILFLRTLLYEKNNESYGYGNNQ